MRTLGGIGVALLLATALGAQSRNFGSVVFPGGTSAQPGVTRNFGSVVFPGGVSRITPPGVITDPSFGVRLGATVAGQNVLRRFPPSRNFQHRTGIVAVPYAYPVFVGGGYGGGYYDNPYGGEPAASQSQPNIMVIYPPQPAPVIINQFDSASGMSTSTTEQRPAVSQYQAPMQQPVEEAAATTEPPHYLIAFKDHTVYAAVAYWVDGDTVHYFTSGNTHNQVSLSLIDRELTERLNKESGISLTLPRSK